MIQNKLVHFDSSFSGDINGSNLLPTVQSYSKGDVTCHRCYKSRCEILDTELNMVFKVHCVSEPSVSYRFSNFNN